MASELFIFPGVFDREIDLTTPTVEPTGIPAGVIGATQRGPAFIPRTIGSFEDFRTKYGNLHPNLPATYAVEAFLENQGSLTFSRVLGAGANSTSEDIEETRLTGRVRSAGFVLDGSDANSGSFVTPGNPKYLFARHKVTANEAFGYPMFTNNSATYFTSGAADEVYLLRSVIFPTHGTAVGVSAVSSVTTPYLFGISSSITPLAPASQSVPLFYITVFNSGSVNADAISEQHLVALDPSHELYIGKVLNTDPTRFKEFGHYLYADFPVDSGVAYVSASNVGAILFASGSSNESANAGVTGSSFFESFRCYNARYTTPTTTWFISQPYGTTEYDLFKIESLDDGAYANNKFKVSISNLQKSANPRNEYGLFTITVRDFNDTDVEPRILEQYVNLSLDPMSDNYVAKVIGDKRAYFNFDVEDPQDRRVVTEGLYPNRSKLIRVVMNTEIAKANGTVPQNALPFGFRGQPTINTNPRLVDATGSAGFDDLRRFYADDITDPRMVAGLVPPVPFRFKITRGEISTAGGGLVGAPGSTEITDGRYYWGVKFERTENVLNPNVSTKPNTFIENNNKMLGLAKLDLILTGSACDIQNANKFTLARVALGNAALNQVTSSVTVHMREAAYIRDGIPDSTNYLVNDGVGDRVTFATLYHKGTTAAEFNRFSEFTKFTTTLFGGWDGTNIFDKNSVNFSDKATSAESRGTVIGNANTSFISPGFNSSQDGSGVFNNAVNAFRVATDVITNPIASNINLLAVPGQKDPFVTDYVGDKTRDFGIAMYLQDVPSYNGLNERIFDGEAGVFVDFEYVMDALESRAIDNEYIASYAPGIVINDSYNQRKVTVPGSIAALAAIAYNDKVAYPWFAPAGFNRAALSFVDRTQARVKQNQRERAVTLNLNPIVKFPNEGHVIFSQKTMKQDQSALQSINVQRMVMDVKRQVIEIGNKILWDNIDTTIYENLNKNVSNALSVVQTKKGIEKFQVICNNTNNTAADRDANKINMRIRFVPTRSIEYVTLDFIITRSGVAFV